MFAQNGYCHGDLPWRHVGLVSDDAGKPVKPDRAALFDFGNTVRAKPAEAKLDMNKSLGLPLPSSKSS